LLPLLKNVRFVRINQTGPPPTLAGLGKRAFRQTPTHAPWTQTRLLGDGSGRHAKVLPCHDLLIERKAAFPTSLLNALDYPTDFRLVSAFLTIRSILGRLFTAFCASL